jgi:fructose-1,6-bisphosphatase/inositol monophosphatase family enzyme
MVGMGADGSPTEELDRIAEAQVLSVVEEAGMDWDVLSEEIGHVRRGGDRTLVVDPIDGSHNALRGLPFATVSLGLGRANLGGIDVGVVHDLSGGSTYWAVRGQGAYRDGRPLHVRSWDTRQELFFVNLGRHAAPAAVRRAAEGRRIRSLGCASFEMAMVAQGGADAYFFENDTENRNLRVTDIAAAYRILSEAGGGTVNAGLQPIDGMPLSLGHHTSVVAYGDPAFLEHLRGAASK